MAPRVRVIMEWTLVSATVGLVLRTISGRAGAIERIVVGIVGATWTVATYFTVPILAFEGPTSFKATRRSSAS